MHQHADSGRTTRGWVAGVLLFTTGFVATLLVAGIGTEEPAAAARAVEAHAAPLQSSVPESRSGQPAANTPAEADEAPDACAADCTGDVELLRSADEAREFALEQSVLLAVLQEEAALD